MSDTTFQFWLWLILIFSIFIQSSSAEKKNIPAESGQTVALPCRAPNNNIIVLEWSRTDLEPAYVLLYRDRLFETDDQHPSFKDRMDLQDRKKKDGDVSLILKDVMTDDTGTYECRVVQRGIKLYLQRGTNRWKRAYLKTPPISIITLRVSPPGPSGGITEDAGKEDARKEDAGKEDASVGIAIGLIVASYVVGGAAFWCHKKIKKH